jgi:hypothetical protein
MPTKVGIQNLLKILDSPVSSTGQAQSRASLARNDETVIVTQSQSGGYNTPQLALGFIPVIPVRMVYTK